MNLKGDDNCVRVIISPATPEPRDTDRAETHTSDSPLKVAFASLEQRFHHHPSNTATNALWYVRCGKSHCLVTQKVNNVRCSVLKRSLPAMIHPPRDIQYPLSFGHTLVCALCHIGVRLLHVWVCVPTPMAKTVMARLTTPRASRPNHVE